MRPHRSPDCAAKTATVLRQAIPGCTVASLPCKGQNAGMNKQLVGHRWSGVAILVALIFCQAAAGQPAPLELAKVKTAAEYKAAVERILADDKLPWSVLHTTIFPPADVLGPQAQAVHLELLVSENKRVRAFAAGRLAEEDKPSAEVAALLLERLMADDDYQTRQFLVVALGKAGPEIVPSLLAQLQKLAAGEKRDDQRTFALIEILGQLRATDAVEPLLAMIKTYSVRHVIIALGRIGDARAAASIVPLLKDHRYELRSAAAIALSRIDDDAGRQALLDHLLSHEGDIPVEVVAAMVEWKEPRLLPAMQETLKSHRDPGARAAAARWMGESKLRSELPRLTEALKDQYPEVSMAAATALHAMGQTRVAMDEIRNTLTKSGGFTHKNREAIAALVAIGPGIAPTVAATLRDTKVDMAAREHYAQALGQMGPQGQAAATALLRDKEGEVRSLAMTALAASKDIKHLAAMERIAETDPESFVRRHAAHRIEDYGWPGYRILFKLIAKQGPQFEQTRLAAATALESCTTLPDAALALGKALSDPSPRVRRQAAISLTWFPPASAIPTLEAAAAREQDKVVAGAIKQALDQLRQRAAR